MLKTRPLAITAAIGIGVLMLAGCSGDDVPDEPTTPEPVAEEPAVEETTPAPEEEPVVEEESPEPAAPAGDGTEATPGQAFAIGETARVGWDTYDTDEPVFLDVTVDSVTEGNLDDILALDLREETVAALEGHTPYYVDFSIVKADPSQLEIAHRSATGEIGARDAGGTKLPELSLLGGGFDTCVSNAFGRDIDEGATTTSCSIFMVPQGREFGVAIWAQYDTPYSDSDGEPITWK